MDNKVISRFWCIAAVVAASFTTHSLAHAAGDLAATASGWDRSNLIEAFTSLAGGSPRIVERTAPAADKDPKGAETFADQAKRLAPTDRIWIVTPSGLDISIAMAGTDDRINTINIYEPLVNFSPKQGKLVEAFNNGLFQQLFPDWPEASSWWRDSLGRTWRAMADNWGTHDPAIMDTFVERRTQGPVLLSTAGVPPDIQFWQLTVRPACEMDIHDPDVFQRWVC